jgi:hypothetical protein
MRVIILAVLMAFLTACAAPPIIEYVDRPYPVEVIVVAPIPEPPVIKTAFLPIWLLEPEHIDNPDTVSLYYVKSVKMLQTKNNQLQCALDGYRTETEPQCQN